MSPHPKMGSRRWKIVAIITVSLLFVAMITGGATIATYGSLSRARATARVRLAGGTVTWPKTDWNDEAVYVDLSNCAPESHVLRSLNELGPVESVSLGHRIPGEIDLSPLSQLTNLRFVSIHGANDGQLSKLSGCAKLETLDLSHSSGISQVGLDHLKVLAHLSELNFWDNKLDDAALGAISKLTSLEVLYLGYSRLARTPGEARASISDSGMSQLATLSRLKCLRVTSATVGDASISTILKFKNLEQLSLDSTDVTDARLAELAGLKKLQFVSIRYTRSATDGIERLRMARPDVEVGSKAYFRRTRP